ncbi:MAG: 6-bladed beta-propeller [Acidobacteriota bacterium]|nr:6-bladed beta-propeller [Acidobacteriota bacterium]
MTKKGWSPLAVILSAAFAVVLSAACSSKPKEPQRSIENGIEVVDNGAEIYTVPGQPSALSFKEEFRIDLEAEALAAAGLTDIVALDADSKGRIYLFRSMRSPGPLVFQFDERGKFLKSFCPLGQGPGEAQYPAFLGVNPQDEIRVLSQGPERILSFNGDGRLLWEEKITFDALARPNQYEPLVDGNFVARYYRFDEKSALRKIYLGLFDAGFKKIKELRNYDFPESVKPGMRILTFLPVFASSASAFYVNWGAEGRDIAMFDLDGRMKRIIRSDFPPQTIPPEYKKEVLDRIPSGDGYREVREYIRALDVFPAFQAFLTDDQGRLFVVGSEKDPASGANRCDVFSPEGIRIMRTGLGSQDLLRYSFEGIVFDVVLKNGCAYCVREKPDGYKEVVVYSMIWD